MAAVNHSVDSNYAVAAAAAVVVLVLTRDVTKRRFKV